MYFREIQEKTFSLNMKNTFSKFFDAIGTAVETVEITVHSVYNINGIELHP